MKDTDTDPVKGTHEQVMNKKREALALALDDAPEFEFAEGVTQEDWDAEVSRGEGSLYGKDGAQEIAQTAINLTRLLDKARQEANESGEEFSPSRAYIELLENTVDTDGHSGGHCMKLGLWRIGMDMELKVRTNLHILS